LPFQEATFKIGSERYKCEAVRRIFTQPGCRIDIEVAPRNDDVVFSVRDTGAGIPPDALPHIFERFHQAETSDRRGLGLGLYIVRCIVEAHGGRIWATSAIGEGSLFCFTLPRAAA
jgi:signal transduction histidine kinase